MTRADASERSNPPIEGSAPLRRMLRYARPYALLILLTVLLAGGLSASRYTRAYLMKPIFDDIVLPEAQLPRAPSGDWLLAVAWSEPRAARDAAGPAGATPDERRGAAPARASVQRGLRPRGPHRLRWWSLRRSCCFSREYTVQ